MNRLLFVPFVAALTLLSGCAHRDHSSVSTSAKVAGHGGPSAADVAEGSWVQVDNALPRDHSYAPVVEAAGRVWLLGARYEEDVWSVPVEDFGVPKGSWREEPSLKGFGGYAGAAVVNDSIYAPGGWNGPETLEILDATDPSDGWVSGPSMNEPRRRSAAIAVGTDIYVIGGDSSPKTMERLDTTDLSRGWEMMPGEMTTSRRSPCVFLVGDHIYVAGDRRDRSTGSYTVERFDTAQPEQGWERLDAKLSANRGYAAAMAADGHIYVVGGFKNSRRVERLDTTEPTSSWEDVPQTVTGMYYPAGIVIDNELYIVGGSHPRCCEGSKVIQIIGE